MGVGHFAAGLIFKRVDPRLNLGVLFFAAILSDFLLGIFFRLGLEHATIPANYVDVSSVRFDFLTRTVSPHRLAGQSLCSY